MDKDDMNLIGAFFENAAARNMAVIIVYAKNNSNDPPRVTANVTKESIKDMLTDLFKWVFREKKNEL